MNQLKNYCLDRPYIDQYNNTISRKLLDFTTITLHSVGNRLNLSNVGGLNTNEIKSWFSDINPVTFLTLVLSGAVGTFVGIIAKRIIMQKIQEKERHVRVSRNNH